MNNSHDNHDIKDNVLEKIRTGQVHIRPRAYFIAKIALVVFVAALAFIASAFVASFIFFSLHEGGELFLLGFGFRGFLTFISLFPWLALLVAAALVVILEWLLRHFKFNYRIPILKAFTIGLGVAAIVGLVISITPIHGHFLEKSERGELPIFGDQYKNIYTPHEEKGEFRGVVVSVGTSTLTITHNDRDNDVDDGTRTAIFPPGFDTSQFNVGDRVYIAGSLNGNDISVYGIHRF